MKNKLSFPKIDAFSLSLFHEEPLTSTTENALLLVAKSEAETVLGRRVYALKRGDALLALPYSYLAIRDKKSIFSGYQLHLPLDALRAFAPSLYLQSEECGTPLSFSLASSNRLLSICEGLGENTLLPTYAIPEIFSILEKDALPKSDNSMEIPLPKLLRRALAYIENARTPIDTAALASRYGVSESTLFRAFRTHLSTTPRKYAQALLQIYKARSVYQTEKNGD